METAAAILLLLGTGFTLIAAIGLVRLPDFYTRMHAPTKAGTVGVSSIAAAAALTLPGDPVEIALKGALIIFLFFVTAPIGAHMLARAARAAGVPAAPCTHIDELPPAPRQAATEDPDPAGEPGTPPSPDSGGPPGIRRA